MSTKLTATEQAVVTKWDASTPGLPGSSVPGLTKELVQRLKYYPVDSTYEELYGFAPDASWDRDTVIDKLLVLNEAIKAADARCQAKNS